MLVVPACLAAAFLMGLRVNMTPSLPRGLYIMSGDAPARGDTVGFCLTGAFAGLGGQRSYLAPSGCASGLRPLLKVLAGVPGDRVAVENGTVCINGVAWPHGIRKLDSSGRPVPSCLESTTIPAGRALFRLFFRFERAFEFAFKIDDAAFEIRYAAAVDRKSVV